MTANPIPSAVATSRLRILAVVGILAATFVVYTPHLNDFFLSDDFHYLRACDESAAFGADDEWYAVTVGQLDFHFRPLFGLTNWLTYVGFGADPLWWHLGNLCLHLLAVWLTIVLVRRFVSNSLAAIAAGALFGLHFINAETVVWMSARTSLLVTVLVMAAVVVETSPRERPWGIHRWVALVLAIMAHLSKEHAVALPLLLLLVPTAPINLDEPLTTASHGRLRAFGTAIYRRVVHFWPYVILTTLFIIIRFGAVMASTEALFYRLELHANVLKNFAFLCVSTLFPLDFRAALGAWNSWYLQGDAGALSQFLVTYPGVIVGTVLAIGLWCSVFLWGHRAAKLLAAWVIIAALPVLFFRGTGERLIYISLPGMAGAVGVILAVWHRAFVASFRRAGPWISPVLMMLILAINVHWLNNRLLNWRSASELSRTIVAALSETSIPSGATVRFTGVPDNIHGAWVFRLGIDDAFTLYADRSDVRALPTRADAADDPDVQVLEYVWTGDAFVRSLEE